MKKSIGLFMISILAFAMFLGVVSAGDLSFSPEKLTGKDSHDSELNIKFTVENSNETLDFKNIVYTFSDLASGSNEIAKENLAMKKEEKAFGNNSETDLQADIEIPEFTSPGTYEGNLTIDGDFNGTSESLVIPIEIEVTEDNSLTVTPTTTTITSNDNQTSVTITNNGNTALNDVYLSIKDITGATFSYDASEFDLDPSQTETITINVETTSSLPLGENTATINVYSDEKNASSSFKIIKDYCDTCTNEGSLDLEIKTSNIKVIKGYGDDDDYWYLLDEVEVRVEVDNTGSWDIDDIEIEWVIYNTNNEKIMDGEVDKLNLKHGKDEKFTFTFVLDEDISKFDGENAVLYVRAKGKIDDKDAGIHNKEYTCHSDSEEVEIQIDSHFVIVEDFEIDGIKLEDDFYSRDVFCGQEVTIEGKFWNIGNSEEDDVTLRIKNKDLNIDDIIDLSSIDAFDSESFSYTFNVPEGLEEKTYYISFSVYDEDNDIYESDKSDESQNHIGIRVQGGCKIIKPLITASMVSEEAVAGKELVFTSTITNPGEEEITLTLSSTGYEEWGNLKNINPMVVILQPGEAKEVSFEFDIEKDAEGEKIFEIHTSEGDKIIETKQVSVTIDGRNSFSLGIGGVNWKLIGVILLNLVLITAIISVAVKIKKRK